MWNLESFVVDDLLIKEKYVEVNISGTFIDYLLAAHLSLNALKTIEKGYGRESSLDLSTSDTVSRRTFKNLPVANYAKS